jgi:hypothetical protein
MPDITRLNISSPVVRVNSVSTFASPFTASVEESETKSFKIVHSRGDLLPPKQFRSQLLS